jgi:protein-disulfide isomerase
MKNIQRAMAALITGSVIYSGIALADGPAFTPEQEARIGTIAADYLVAHPEVLIQAGQQLQIRQQEQQIKSIESAVLKHQSRLLDDKNSPSYGPADASVVVVEFFDYQCVVCSRQAPELDKIMKANLQVRYVFKEWPIFASRWENSLKAAETGLQVWKQKGASEYLSYHNAIFASGHNEGKLTAEDINNAVNDAKFSADKKPDVQSILSETNTLAHELGLRGTPAMIIMPTKNATKDNITVIPGMAKAEVLQAAIQKAIGLK